MPLSDFTITLSKSNDYLRCAVLLHLLAMIVLLRSAIPVMVIVAFLLILTLSMTSIACSRTPLPKLLKLTYHPGYWLLHEVKGREIKYERATIGFDGGVFMLLTLAGNSPQKILVIFNDQITTAQYRLLKFIASNVR